MAKVNAEAVTEYPGIYKLTRGSGESVATCAHCDEPRKLAIIGCCAVNGRAVETPELDGKRWVEFPGGDRD